MKVVMINTSDRRGGAAVAASRLREALVRSGVDVKTVVSDKTTDDPNVIPVGSGWLGRRLNRFRFLWERLVIFLHNGCSRERLFAVSLADTGANLAALPEVRQADIIHLHWFNQGLLSLHGLEKLLALGKPVVWTLHDMWGVTAICHHAWTCERYQTGCGKCPFLDSRRENDLSGRVFRKKKKIYARFPDLTLVPVSGWLEEKCRASALTAKLATRVIPNTIDADLFSPGDRIAARRNLNLPSEKKVITLGAVRIDDPLKGFSLLKKALGMLPERIRENSLLVLFGRFRDESALMDMPLPYLCLGSIGDPARVAELYRATDVTVSSSHYETFGQTVSEAMACGCPVVSFDSGGQREIIDHRTNGWLARYPDPEELARGIEWVLDHPQRDALSESARQKILARFTSDRVAGEYIDLYGQLLKPKQPDLDPDK